MTSDLKRTGLNTEKNRKNNNLGLRFEIVYLLVCHVPFPAQGAVRILHRAGNHMTDQQIYFQADHAVWD